MAKRASTWKATERSVAAKLGGRRLGPTGRATEDVATEKLAVECKHKKSLPAWLHSAMAQAEAAAKDGRLPLVVLHQCGMHHNLDFVVLRLRDWVAWYGEVEATEERGGGTG